jgi:hypothetical protein
MEISEVGNYQAIQNSFLNFSAALSARGHLWILNSRKNVKQITSSNKENTILSSPYVLFLIRWNYAMKLYGVVDVQIYVFLTSVLVWGKWSASCPGRFAPRERAPCTYRIRGWVVLRSGLDDVDRGEILPLLGLEIRSLGLPARSRLTLIFDILAIQFCNGSEGNDAIARRFDITKLHDDYELWIWIAVRPVMAYRRYHDSSNQGYLN